MKKMSMSITFLLYSYCMQSSEQALTPTQIQLVTYLQRDIEKKQAIIDTRNQVLLTAADQLQERLNRSQFKQVRITLRNGLFLKSELSASDKRILDNLEEIRNNHARRFPCCCKPWVFQSTIAREAQSLYDIIDEIIKEENQSVYESVKCGQAPFQDSVIIQAYPVDVTPSAPALQESLLHSTLAKRK